MAEQITSLSTADAIVVGVYLFGLVPIGLWYARRTKSDADFAVAGRRLSTPLIAVSAFASWVGLAGLFGTPENVFKFGLSGLWWFQAWLPGVLLMAFLLAGRLRARLHITIPELVSEHSSASVRVAACLVVSWNYVAWVAVQVFALGLVFSMFTDLSRTTGAVIAFVVVIGYTLCGGLPAVVATDVIQATVMVVVVALVAPILALTRDGGWPQIASATRDIPDFYTLFAGAGGKTLAVWFLSLVPAAFIDPGGLQRVFAASKPAVAKRGLLLAACIYFLFGVSVTFMGIVARATMPSVDPQQAMPAVLFHLLPAGLTGLAIVAFLGAAMSSADTALLVVATTLQRDVYAHFRPGITEGERVVASRVLVMLVGLAALGLALVNQSVVDIVLLGFAVYVPGLLLPVLAASYGWRLPTWSMLATILMGVFLAVGWVVFGEPMIPAIVAGLLASAIPFSVGLLSLARATKRHVE